MGPGPENVQINDQVVEALSTQRPDDAFHNRVRTRRSNGRGDGVDTDAAGALAEVMAVDCIAVPQQMARLLSPGRGLDELPPHPGSRRVGGHVDMHQLTPTMGNEHQHVQRLERQCGDAQQIGGPEMVSVVAQESAPGLAR